MTDIKDKEHLYALADAQPARDSLTLLDAGDIQFLLQDDLVSLQPINRMQEIAGELACGVIEFEGESLQVFSLNHHLQLQVPALAHCNAVAILVADDQRFGFVCCNLEKLTGPAPRFYPVPVSMSSRKQPFAEFAVINNKAVGLSNSAELLRLLLLRGVKLQSGGQQLLQKNI